MSKLTHIAFAAFGLQDAQQADTTATASPLAGIDSTVTSILENDGLIEGIAELFDAFGAPDFWKVLLVKVSVIALVILVAWLIIRLISKASRTWMNRFSDLPPLHPRRQRAHTIGNLFTSSARYLIWPLAFITILTELSVNVGALIATAGVAGFAIGFGAQTLVKDVIGGIFLLFDDTIHVGDLIRIGTDEGLVEDIGVRMIRVRRFNGELIMVPAGELRIFGNRSIEFARVIVEVSLSYEQDLDATLEIIREVAMAWAAERRNILLEEEPTVQAITLFGDSGITARVVIKTIPGEQFQAERDLRVMIKRTFDQRGIEIPFPRRTIYMRSEADPTPKPEAPPPPPPPDDNTPEATD